MKIVITNDDGIDSVGIKVLAKAIAELPFEVYVVAPEKQRSAGGHSITTHKPLRINEVDIGIKGIKAFSTNGSTADCVILAKDVIVNDMDFVISGINELPNVGDDISYSGTVSGSIEAILNDVPSFSVSICGFGENLNRASQFSKNLLLYLIENPLKKGRFLNVNFPGSGKIKGVKITKIGRVKYVDRTVKRIDPSGKPYYWIMGKPVWSGDENTDTWAIKNGYVSVSPLRVNFVDDEEYRRLKEEEDKFLPLLDI